jgi:replicative superfamily II helicase
MADDLEAQRVEYRRVFEELKHFRTQVDVFFHQYWGSGKDVRDFQRKTVEVVHIDGGCAVICVPTGKGKSMPSQLLALMRFSWFTGNKCILRATFQFLSRARYRLLPRATLISRL